MDAESFDALTRALVGRRLVLATLAALAADLTPVAPVAAKKRKSKRKHKRKKPGARAPGCPVGQRPCLGGGCVPSDACCPATERYCNDRCIPKDACCADADCLSRGECASYHFGECLPDDRICTDTYGACSECHHQTATCVHRPHGTSCPLGECASCLNGECRRDDRICVNEYGPCFECDHQTATCVEVPFGTPCDDRGECATCQYGECRADDSMCTDKYGPCFACDRTTFTCNPTGTPCAQGAGFYDCCQPEESCCGGGCCSGTCCGTGEDGYCWEPGWVCCTEEGGAASGCPPDLPWKCCEDRCVNLETSENDCGRCGHSCRGERCLNGECVCRDDSLKWCESARQCYSESDREVCCGAYVCNRFQHCCGSYCSFEPDCS